VSEKNAPIGTVKCPYTDCTETCNVYRFRKRAGDEKLSRFAGKLYADCPTHGRIGADGKAATQEYLLSNADIPTPKNGGAGETPAPHKASPSPSPKKAPANGSQSSSPAASSSTSSNAGAPVKRPWWAPVIE
jgi:hypothetical protein